MTIYRFKLLFFNNNKSFSLFSLPKPSPYHQISNLKINSKNYQIIDEKKWGNKVVVLKNKSEITFTVKPFPFKSSINPKFTLSSYQKTKIPKVYLTPNRFINGKDEKIKSLAKKILGQETNLLTVVKKLYDFTLEYLTYGKPIDELYPYSQALNEKITDCGGFSTFLASLLQSQNIPSRLVVGFLIKRRSFLKEILSIVNLPKLIFKFKKLEVRWLTLDDLLIHAWLEILLPDDSFFPLDPSIEWRRKKGKTQRQGGFGFIPADRLVTSYGCDFDLNINGKNYKIDLLQKPLLVTCNL
jgi:transglutaminase-like putative cysteine protease